MLKIFCSYAKEDRDLVLPYYQDFKSKGFVPWIDYRDIKGGQNWEGAIDKALKEADVVTLFLSPRSASKRGFVQREVKDALENLRYKLPDDIYIVPILLESCDVPENIGAKLQYIEAWGHDAADRINESLELAAAQRKIALERGEVHGMFRVFNREIQETKEGSPGYDVSIAYPEFTSDRFADAAQQLTAIYKGRANNVLVRERRGPWDNLPDWPQDSPALNGRWEAYTVAFSSRRLLSIRNDVGWYGAGAAHPNSHFETFNYALSDDGNISAVDPRDTLKAFYLAKPIIVEYCEKAVLQQLWERDIEIDDDLRAWVHKGLEDHSFDQCTFSEEGLTFYFSPYEIAAYAFGSFIITVPYFELREHLNKGGVYSLTGRG